jgi:hypothetical protein
MDMILGNVAPAYNSEKDQNPDSSEKKKKG